MEHLLLANAPVIATVIPLLLCPSDIQEVVDAGFGPTNYAMCAGTGLPGGSPIAADGVFYVNSATRLADITDGSSQTIVASESLLGTGQEPVSDRKQVDTRRDYAFFLGGPLTDAPCAGASQWNVTNRRGFAWVSGEFRCALQPLLRAKLRVDRLHGRQSLRRSQGALYALRLAHGPQPAHGRRERAASGRFGSIRQRPDQSEHVASAFRLAIRAKRSAIFDSSDACVSARGSSPGLLFDVVVFQQAKVFFARDVVQLAGHLVQRDQGLVRQPLACAGAT